MEKNELLTGLLTEAIDRMGECGNVTVGQYKLLEYYLGLAFGLGADEDRKIFAHRKKVLKIKDGIVVGEYPSLTAAAKSVCGDLAHISEAANGKAKSSYGFQWKLA